MIFVVAVVLHLHALSVTYCLCLKYVYMLAKDLEAPRFRGQNKQLHVSESSETGTSNDPVKTKEETFKSNKESDPQSECVHVSEPEVCTPKDDKTSKIPVVMDGWSLDKYYLSLYM